ncbi:MAG: penicillin-binding protein 2 [Bacilli bacterium]|nr:penicillin-binding protein 2 [Bacilli bacterium]
MKKTLNKKNIDIKKIIEKRYNILIIIIMISMLILLINLFYIQVIQKDKYVQKLNQLQVKVVEGPTAPRGRIYDRNNELIVDNKPIKEIYYVKPKKTTVKQEIKTAYFLAQILDVNYDNITEFILKNFWLKNNSTASLEKITNQEWEQLKQRKITTTDIEKIKIDRITTQELEKYNELDKEAAYIYYLMNKGYSYEEKIIKRDNITDLEYASLASNLNTTLGINIRLDWDRTYLYQETFRSLLGNISSFQTGIPSDLKTIYLNKGYNLNDRVGISYLEYQYDDYLRGIKNQYQVKYNNEKKLIKSGQRGNDIVLTIDIKLQQEIEKIIEEEIIKAKKEPNTEYYNRSFVIITNPNTGEILAASGKQIVQSNDSYKIYDYTPGIVTSPITVGSAIKGASQIVGYKYKGVEINEKRYDNCVKIASTPLKCSWKSLGLLNDITALKYSSNTYQFYTAMNVAGIKYIYNGPLKVEQSIFDKYRSIFGQFGLGVKTEIDLPVESIGYKGKNDNGGLLLDFVIGQYDTYTPIQLAQYISTIANNGNRMKLYFLKKIYQSTKNSNLTNLIYETKNQILNKVDIDEIYLNRIKEGFKAVLETGGTGSGYIDKKYKPAGKTGTSQSFVDTNNDNKIDTETITTTFVGYAPYDNPQVTFTVISPDVSNYQSYVNKRIAKRVSDKYFEIYK